MKGKKALLAILLGLCVGMTSAALFTACEKEETSSSAPQTSSSTESESSSNSENVEETVGSEGLQYIISEDETYYQVKGLGACEDRKIVIPSQYKGLPVKEILTGAFRGEQYITEVIIPDTITGIGDSAFSWCSSLTSVEIPDSVTSIGGWAFYECSSLTEIVIPDSVTSIGDYAFQFCSNLTSVVIPNSVTSIGDYVFFDCSGLTSVVIPDSVTSIGSDAFGGCNDNLKVYCEAESKPDAWEDDWNLIRVEFEVIYNPDGGTDVEDTYIYTTVEWGYKGK